MCNFDMLARKMCQFGVSLLSKIQENIPLNDLIYRREAIEIRIFCCCCYRMYRISQHLAHITCELAKEIQYIIQIFISYKRLDGRAQCSERKSVYN